MLQQVENYEWTDMYVISRKTAEEEGFKITYSEKLEKLRKNMK